MLRWSEEDEQLWERERREDEEMAAHPFNRIPRTGDPVMIMRRTTFSTLY